MKMYERLALVREALALKAECRRSQAMLRESFLALLAAYYVGQALLTAVRY